MRELEVPLLSHLIPHSDPSSQGRDTPQVSSGLPPAKWPLLKQLQLHGLPHDFGEGSWGTPPLSHQTVELSEPKENGVRTGTRAAKAQSSPVLEGCANRLRRKEREGVRTRSLLLLNLRLGEELTQLGRKQLEEPRAFSGNKGP